MFNPYPGIDLRRTLARFARMEESALGRTKFNRRELYSALDLSPTTGGRGAAIVSSFVEFGLLQRLVYLKSQGWIYAYTDLGQKLLYTYPGDKEYGVLLERALGTSELYQWLIEVYADQLPNDISDVLVAKYEGRGVRKANVGTIIRNYQRSVTYVKRLTSLRDEESQQEGTIPVNIDGGMVCIDKRYLAEAIRKTAELRLADKGMIPKR